MSKKRVHILGICGTFMGGLALLGKEKGMDISGCDNNVYPPMSDHLNDMGIEIIESYDPSHLPKADEYVIGNSIKPEGVFARGGATYLQKKFGFKPKISIEKGIKYAIEYFSKNK